MIVPFCRILVSLSNTLCLSKLEFGISILLLIYILGPFDTPTDLMSVFKTPFAAIIIFGLLAYLFCNAHVIVTVLYIFAIYELLKRADEYKTMIDEENNSKMADEAFFNMIDNVDDDELNNLIEGFDDDQLDDLIEGFQNGEFADIEGFENDLEDEDMEGFENDLEDEDMEGFEDIEEGYEEDGNSIVNPNDVADAAADLAENSNLASSPSLQTAENLENTAAAQSQLAAGAQGDVGTTDSSGGATVTEAFTQLLGINSLENEEQSL